MGQHGGESQEAGSGWWSRFVARCVAVLYWGFALGLVATNLLKSIQARLWRIRRSRRWLICWTLAILTFLIPVVASNVMNRGYERDFIITKTQSAEQGTLLEEDYAACSMTVESRGKTMEAETSCNTGTSFPAGTRVSVVQDPIHPERFLVVEPGQAWREPSAFDSWFGFGIGTILGLIVFFDGYWVLLLVDRPRTCQARRPTLLADGGPGRPRSDAKRSPIDRPEKWWEAKKASVVAQWTKFIVTDVRVRGTLASACLILASMGLLALHQSAEEQPRRDIAVVNNGTIVYAALLDYGTDSSNPSVRYELAGTSLAYPLRDLEAHELGEAIPVVADPVDAARVIPTEIAAGRGPFYWVTENALMVIALIVAVGGVVVLLIPHELEAVGNLIVERVNRKRPKPST
ncbi:hypothetical protein ACFSF4_15900 [Paeniglutamicibacter kerguelensis]